MGKTYIDAVKYNIKASLHINGMVEKPDVVGAIFGQTEGLLGDELDLRELQKSGRIGRIEVKIRPQAGSSNGEIIIPSSLDRVETSIIAAALETIDRVGPCDAKIRVIKVEDTRSAKRDFVINRAKSILSSFVTNQIPESQELADKVREEVRTAEIQSYGPDKLPAGPNVHSSDSVIIVEGRADVLNLLKHDIKNVVGMMGKKIPRSISSLAKQKTATVFIDGDRGGDLIVLELAEVAEIDFVAKAPTGHEVEELSQKEIIKCLRRKIPIEQFLEQMGRKMPKGKKEFIKDETKSSFYSKNRKSGSKSSSSPSKTSKPETKTETKTESKSAGSKKEDEEKLKKMLKELEGSLKAQVLDKDLKKIADSPVRDAVKLVEEKEDIEALVLDGIVTQRLVDLADSKKIRYLAGVKKGKLSKVPSSLTVITN